MASTRKRSNRSEYDHEQFYADRGNSRQFLETTHKPYFAGDGLLVGRLTNRELSNNPVDTESFLLGINSNTLNDAHIRKIVPEIRVVKSLNIYEKPKVQVEKPLYIDPNQRKPLFMA